ncbi:MAG: ECF transporter S component [Spirochaetia bacterium]|nr:ECF transporter S component [Spirochaetia bacterium]MBR4796574.1 ECF transporter S component [Spirochaetia bacterium]MBR5016752.1 ECF transporter S component [Spirochaetia bacterium]
MKTVSSVKSTSFKIASAAILTAVTVVMTIAVRIPVAPTRGYINLGDLAIYFTALSFGPVTAFIAGGLGTAIADILSGFSQWAPFSFIIHGLQGLAVGLIFKILLKKENNFSVILSGIIVFAVGTVIMAGGYFAVGSIMAGTGAAVVEIPGNIVQNLAGIIGGYLLYSAVKKAYPPFVNFRS